MMKLGEENRGEEQYRHREASERQVTVYWLLARFPLEQTTITYYWFHYWCEESRRVERRGGVGGRGSHCHSNSK